MKLKDFHLSETIGEDNYRLQKSNECLLNSYYTLKKEYEVSYAKLKNSNLELKRLSEENLLLKQSLDRLKLNTSSTKDEDYSKEFSFEDLRKVASSSLNFPHDTIIAIWKSDVDSYNKSIRESTEMKPMRRVKTHKPK
jgi:predicted nuclease with TOPRIM domain